MEGRGLDSCGSRQAQVAGSCDIWHNILNCNWIATRWQ